MTDRDFAIYHSGNVTLVCLDSDSRAENAACSGIIGVGHSIEAAQKDWLRQFNERFDAFQLICARMEISSRTWRENSPFQQPWTKTEVAQ